MPGLIFPVYTQSTSNDCSLPDSKDAETQKAISETKPDAEKKVQDNAVLTVLGTLMIIGAAIGVYFLVSSHSVSPSSP